MMTAESITSKRPVLRLTVTPLSSFSCIRSMFYTFSVEPVSLSCNLFVTKLAMVRLFVIFQSQKIQDLPTNQIKSSLYSPYYAEACNELRSPSPRLSAWATQLRRNVATVASRWRHCVDLTGPGMEPQTSRTDSVRLTTELTSGLDLPTKFAKF